MVYITYLSPAGWDGLVAKDRRHQRGSAATISVTGSGLDSDKQNAVIGLVTRATASIMAGSRLVHGEVGGAMPGLPGLTPYACIRIDSDTHHLETEADKEYCKTECCRYHRQPVWQCKRVAAL